ncbi:Vitelline membrane outer layer protein 1 [Folsomia candida]|uniref:Vitelline membrane outer layer protein 1 n=1 Tax=Folsomia candida TaxID=158441 RepID=A0A226DMG2_FOLCA|nr:Vitelline membrane outer layer protein 1 [Folsomia candida]
MISTGWRIVEGQWIRSDRTTDWGGWGEASFCPVGAYATGLEVKYEEIGRGDDTAINGIALQCAYGSGQPVYHSPRSKEGHWGNWKKCRCSNDAIDRVRAFRLCVQQPQGIKPDDMSAYGLYYHCGISGQKTCVLENRKVKDGICSDWISCPGKYKRICGLRTQVEDRQWSGDDTALNNVDFYCCVKDW